MPPKRKKKVNFAGRFATLISIFRGRQNNFSNRKGPWDLDIRESPFHRGMALLVEWWGQWGKVLDLDCVCINYLWFFNVMTVVGPHLFVHQFGQLPFRWPHTRLNVALIQLPEIARHIGPHDFPRLLFSFRSRYLLLFFFSFSVTLRTENRTTKDAER